MSNSILVAFKNVTLKSKISLVVAATILLSFVTVHCCVLLSIIPASYAVSIFDACCAIAFAPAFCNVLSEMLQVIQSNTEMEKKNTYLEHAAKILRHDMHAGINTYIPRGISSLTRRVPETLIEELKLHAPLQMIRDGLVHTQKVYKGVYEFTNLVKAGSTLSKSPCQLDCILKTYLETTSYGNQIVIKPLPIIDVNEALFCTAVDNLIRNGLKYNDSETKQIHIYIEGDSLIVQDNGRGMTQAEFEHLSKPYTRRAGQQEAGTGLGLGICVAIMQEHGFTISCEKNNIGTKMKIGLC
jgi:light-regulated signal transduction histidine kinase (bacteriophytochrome)